MTEPDFHPRLPYQVPDEDFIRLIDAPKPPSLSIDRFHQWLLMAEAPALPPIEELAKEELRLAGLRINPQTNGPSRGGYSTSLKLQHVPSGQTTMIEGLPEAAHIRHMTWAPDGEHVAFSHSTKDHIECWVLEIKSKRARRLGTVTLNAALGGSPISWHPDSKSLILKCIPDRGEAPQRPVVPAGPVISQSTGEESGSKNLSGPSAGPS